MDLSQMIQATTDILVGSFNQSTGQLATKLSETFSGASETALGGITEAVKGFFSGPKAEPLEDLADDPEDGDFQAAFRVALKKALKNGDFKKDLEALFGAMAGDASGDALAGAVNHHAQNITIGDKSAFIQGNDNQVNIS